MKFPKRSLAAVLSICLLALSFTTCGLWSEAEAQDRAQKFSDNSQNDSKFQQSATADSRLLAANPDGKLAGEVVGITDSEILIGSCCSLTGALAERGAQLSSGARSYLDSINKAGGLNGRKVNFKVCDDKYDPEAAIVSFNTCLKNKVFAGCFFVGSPPIAKYARMADSSKLPMFGFCSGTPSIYEPHPTVFVLRRSYRDETSKLVEDLWEHHGIRKFGIVYQNDAFGAAIREAVELALKKWNAEPIVEASYSRKTQDIDAAFSKLKAANPDAVILGATSDALKGMVMKKNEQNWHTIFACCSVADDYLEALGKQSDEVLVSQVMPPFDDEKLPVVKQFKKLAPKDATMTAFESFINAIVLVEVLKRLGNKLTQDDFVKTMESMKNFDFGGGAQFKVSFSPSNHVGLPPSSIYFSIMRDGKPTAVTGNDWKRLMAAVKAGR